MSIPIEWKIFAIIVAAGVIANLGYNIWKEHWRNKDDNHN